MKKQKKLPFRIREKIERSKHKVFVPADFRVFSDYDQILRVLRRLVCSGYLIKLGQGIYAKTRVAPDGTIMPDGYVGDMVCSALKKLNIKILPSISLRAYNFGGSTQVPTGRVIGVNRRVRRKISYNGNRFVFETIRSVK